MRVQTPYVSSLRLALRGSVCWWSVVAALAQEPLTITGFQANGQLTWTNQEMGVTYGVQWTDALDQPWRQQWQDLRAITATSSVGTVQVPMFYRVARVPTDGLVAHYRFTCDATDGTIHHNDGTVTGAVLTAGRTLDNPAYRFDGTNDAILCGTNAVLNVDTSFTLSAWFFVRHTNVTQFILGKWGASEGYVLGVSAGDGVYLALNNGLQTVGPVTTGAWHHVVATRQSPHTKQYVNGELVYVKTNWNAVVAAANPLVIGDRAPTPNRPLDGWIDDVRVYDRCLEPEEVWTLYQCERP